VEEWKMPTLKLAVFASHGGSNLQAIMDACKNGELDAKVCVVISNNSDAFALERARHENIPCFHMSSKMYSTQEKLDEAIYSILQKYEITIVALAGYMKKLGKLILNNYKVLNIHPALLPKFGGQGMYGENVHEAVLKSGDSETGVTIHLVDDEYDRGRILNQCKVPVIKGDTVETLSKRVLESEHIIYAETLKLISEGKIKL
jgi:phosphoribosylglycinamide formyltransferase-1